MRCGSFWREAGSVAALLVAAACLPATPSAGAEQTRDAKSFYDEFEGLNRPENLDRRVVGGRLPEFVTLQIQLLERIAARPPAEAVPILLRIVTEHIERLEATEAERLAQSPLPALQVPLVDALSRHATRDDVRGALARLAQSGLVKEYARGRALDALVERELAAITPAVDPKGEKRAEVLLEMLLGGLTLSDVFQTPGRLRSLSRRAPALVRDDPTAPWRALAAVAGTAAKRYAADAALALACAQKEAAGAPITQEEKDLLVAACARWLEEFRPAAAKERYPSDLLGESLVRLGARLSHEPLAAPLREAGLLPPR
ncbi:MAG TPA: hypothetical protein VNE39_29170 [Planctomycetota bacterium]|nr:hypothetical protein [Planctomycetota bacterium]